MTSAVNISTCFGSERFTISKGGCLTIKTPILPHFLHRLLSGLLHLKNVVPPQIIQLGRFNFFLSKTTATAIVRTNTGRPVLVTGFSPDLTVL